jgi:hypothetical protein
LNSRLSTQNAGILISAVLAVSACAVRPEVSYFILKDDAPNESSDVNDAYYLQTSTIRIDKTGTEKDAQGNEVDVLTVTSQPTEYQKFKVGIEDRSSWLGTVRTNVNIVKQENTALVKEIGIEVSDKRVDTIKTIGSIVSTIIPVVGFSTQGAVDETKLPWTAKTYTIIEGDTKSADSEKPVTVADGVTVTFGPLPPGVIPVSQLPTGTKTDKYISAACRDATIDFTYAQNVKGARKDVHVKKILKIADPRFYEETSFPAKGKISSHSECGISVTTEADTGVSSGADMVSALATQGKAIKDAIEASKK